MLVTVIWWMRYTKITSSNYFSTMKIGMMFRDTPINLKKGYLLNRDLGRKMNCGTNLAMGHIF